MSFERPILLLTLLVIPLAVALYVLAERRRMKYAIRFTNVDVLAGVVGSRFRRRFVPLALFLLAIAALAARRATPEDVQEMERILEAQAKEVAAGRTGLEQDAEFHAAIGAAAHNRAITRIAHAVMDLLRQSREDSLNTPGRPDRSHNDHQRLLAAIRARDEAAARQAMVDHLEAVEALVIGTDHRRRPAP